MSKEKHQMSDSESSDEDFCPEKELAEESDAVSTDNEEDESADEHDSSPEDNSKQKKKSTKLPTNRDTEISGGSSSRRSTRQTEVDDRRKTREKNTLDDSDEDENEKSRTDALWADFLSDVQPEQRAVEKHTPSTSSTARPKTHSAHSVCANGVKSTNTSNDTDTDTCSVPANDKPTTTTPAKVTVTEVVDFAGEEERVQKTVNADSVKENKTAATNKTPVGRGLPASLKRPAAGASPSSGGLGGILNQIGKKKKLSVLEKTKLDWNTFKEDAGLDEQLKTYNKGKDGYLERQDFLQRTDLRQFEIEKNMRQSTRRTQ